MKSNVITIFIRYRKKRVRKTIPDTVITSVKKMFIMGDHDEKRKAMYKKQAVSYTFQISIVGRYFEVMFPGSRPI